MSRRGSVKGTKSPLRVQSSSFLNFFKFRKLDVSVSKKLFRQADNARAAIGRPGVVLSKAINTVLRMSRWEGIKETMRPFAFDQAVFGTFQVQKTNRQRGKETFQYAERAGDAGPRFLFSGDEIIVDRLAAGEEIDLGVGGMLGKDVARGLGVGL